MNSKEETFDNDIEKGVINEQSSPSGVNNCNVSSMEEKGGGGGGGCGCGCGGDVKKVKVKSAKKPPKPPRPPRGLSLDSADQKLIRELHEIAKLKRARIERMKALKKSKEAKIGSSWKNHLFWTLLTLVFCLVLVFQGISSRTNAGVEFQGSPVSSDSVKDNVLSFHRFPSSLATHVNKPGSESPRHLELVSGSESSTPGQGSTAAG